MGEVSSAIGGPKWNAEAQHHWPGGKYVGYTCHVCGVSGFFHHKNGPRLCYQHWQESQRDAEWKHAKWEADMTAEFGPYVPKPPAPPRRTTMAKLTPTMLAGLQKMAAALKRQSSVLPEPNENTGKALQKRGLIEFAGFHAGWRTYRLTDAGRAALEAKENDHG